MSEYVLKRRMPLTSFIKNNSNAIFAILIIVVLLLMIVPIPTFLLDFFFVLNLSIALTILVVSVYIQKPLEFSTFPSILLVITLFRLSLNIASTRLILLHGSEGEAAAGAIIKTFGSFVVGGNYVVGIIIFLILVLINFIVITKGSGRIAEVTARFTLDAMPGKQMAVDADLSAGLIDEDTAKARRREVTDESDFYGAMDGASKFVKGDAIVGIIVTFINIIAGLIIGVFQQGMDFSSAAKAYTILTVGDGLVSQIPSLVISTAAGIIVSRIASEENFGTNIGQQFTNHKTALYVVSGILLIFMAIPGMPKLLFLFMSGTISLYAYFQETKIKSSDKNKNLEKSLSSSGENTTSEDIKQNEEEQIENLLSVDVAELEVGYGLISLVDKAKDGRLIDRIKGLRRQFASSHGIIIPSIHIRDNLKLQPEEYLFSIKGSEIGRFTVHVDKLLAMAPEGVDTNIIKGIKTKEPAFNLDAVWINPNDKNRAEALGFTIVDIATVISTHLTELIRKNSYKLIGRQEITKLLDVFSKNNSKLVEEVVPGLLSLGELVTVMKNLLYEQVPVKDLQSILETLADNVHKTKNIDILTEFVRQNLAGYITNQFSVDKTLYTLLLDPNLEDLIRKSMQSNKNGDLTLNLPAKKTEAMIKDLTDAMAYFENFNSNPILLVTPEIRKALKNYLDRFIQGYTVLSYAEVSNSVEIKPIATLD
jgi:flagellar biosynthesis protein FlhA